MTTPVAESARPGLDQIRGADPGFDEDQFTGRVEEIFSRLQQARQDRDLEQARPFLSTGLYTSWRLQIEGMLATHRTPVANLRPQRLTIAGASHDETLDHVTVRIEGSGASYQVDDARGTVLVGDPSERPFVQDWTFLRSAGVTTGTRGGAAEQVCPNCGAPLALNESGACRFCQAVITSGQFDWVVSRIDELRPPP